MVPDYRVIRRADCNYNKKLPPMTVEDFMIGLFENSNSLVEYNNYLLQFYIMYMDLSINNSNIKTNETDIYVPMRLSKLILSG